VNRCDSCNQKAEVLTICRSCGAETCCGCTEPSCVAEVESEDREYMKRLESQRRIA
jgi:hypothetical protein